VSVFALRLMAWSFTFLKECCGRCTTFTLPSRSLWLVKGVCSRGSYKFLSKNVLNLKKTVTNCIVFFFLLLDCVPGFCLFFKRNFVSPPADYFIHFLVFLRRRDCFIDSLFWFFQVAVGIINSEKRVWLSTLTIAFTCCIQSSQHFFFVCDEFFCFIYLNKKNEIRYGSTWFLLELGMSSV
jgi:hypothetical protein